MALVLYKCDVCKREISIPRNPKGLETFGRCTITLGCRGRLYQEQLLEDFVRGSLPTDVVGLDNYQQRRVLYNHTQQQTKVSWIIEHGLGTFPVVSVFVDSPTATDSDNRIEVTPVDIVPIDEDTIKLTFDTAVSGIAQLVARASDPQLFNPTEVLADVDEFTQVSSSSELTIATIVSDTQIRVFFEYITPVGAVVPISVVVDNVASAKSAWVGANRVLLQGKIYTVRSFNVVDPAILSGLVPEGSRVIFKGISTNINVPIPTAPTAKQVYLLLADAPYASPDRLLESVVDLSLLSSQSAINSLALSNKEIVITPSTITSVHPPIRSL